MHVTPQMRLKGFEVTIYITTIAPSSLGSLFLRTSQLSAVVVRSLEMGDLLGGSLRSV